MFFLKVTRDLVWLTRVILYNLLVLHFIKNILDYHFINPIFYKVSWKHCWVHAKGITRVIFELPHSIQFAHLQLANLEEQERNILSNCAAVADFVDWTSFSKDRGTWWHLIFGQVMYWNHVPHCHDLTLQAIIDVNFEDVMPSVLW